MKLASQLVEPWAILPEAYRAVVEQTKALMMRDAVPLDGTKDITMRGDVGTIHVKGPLFRYHSWVTEYLGTSSYGELAKDFQKALDDPKVKSILWIFDSPGGEVNGCAELADRIYAARGTKPMRAYVAGTCASAAYFLGSATPRISIAPTAVLGSIGVISMLYDDSKALDEMGIKEYEIVASQSPKKSQMPSDAGYRGRVQQRIDDMAAVFVSSVARYRCGGDEAKVLADYGQGDAMVGDRAVAAGLADEISDVETVIAQMQAAIDKSQASARTVNYFNAMRAKMETNMLAALLKLEGGASERQIMDRCQSLASFEAGILTASGAKSADEAIGKIKAGMEAIPERDALTEKLKVQAQAMVQAEFRAIVKDAIKDGRISLGEVATKIVPQLKAEESAKASAAIAAVTSQSKREILAALGTATISKKRLVQVKAYLDAQPPKAVAPTAKTEPGSGDSVAVATVRAEANQVTSDQVKKFAAEYGLSEVAARAAMDPNFNTVDQIQKLKQ